MYNNQYHHNRNYGCRYKEIIENGYRALVIENELLRISIYLDKGSDIFEFLYKPEDTDFMWKSPVVMDGNRKTPVTKETSQGSFLDIYEGGWQDLLPTIGNPANYLNGDLGTHGELFSLPFNYTVIEDDPLKVVIKMYTRMRRAPLYVEKQITLESRKSYISIVQTITNEAEEEYKFSWGQHPAIGMPFLDENCVIDVPGASLGIFFLWLAISGDVDNSTGVNRRGTWPLDHGYEYDDFIGVWLLWPVRHRRQQFNHSGDFLPANPGRWDAGL